MNSITEDLNGVGRKRQCVGRSGSCRLGNDKSSFNVAPWLSVLLIAAKGVKSIGGAESRRRRVGYDNENLFPTRVRDVPCGWMDGWMDVEDGAKECGLEAGCVESGRYGN
mmetsp:Transcript_25947/g.53659  ORF Transcript_25947/g.53659 Transcript_25947/m.53659 type:complete len:110 (-) Transcript_25947:53-382(-)|eukprot:CAMPEP_0171391166 /NCGR_PEP_ID=MMETSP0880-20121228/1071_1 /TAXON_ID=67004 /ORGANISM="Thalassiosira weissflogii, Strain CCMP1336" /LENGTH=109 /DNA_ID=CAMNT_0011903749 /DNA_START=317 /DNA_END=646 /DNA_ORIENTATION=-